ncbi:MAG: hypothetical protein MJE12_22495, partial [Alphaproteobacteria bacterium]|nr:hypothetical protein [Alphaproteobacteria bacterium]
ALREASDDSTRHSAEIEVSLKNQVAALLSAADTVSARITAAGGAFSVESAGMTEAMREALRLLEDVGNRFQQQTERLTTASVQAGMQINDNRNALRAESEELADVARESAERIQLIGDAFAHQVANLSDSTDGVSTRLTALAENFRTQARDMNNAGDIAGRQVQEIGDALSRQSERILGTTSDARQELESLWQRLEIHSGELQATLDSITEKTRDAGREFDRQAVILTQASAEAAGQAAKLKDQDYEGRRNLFLKTARHIVEDLHSTSIDLTRLLNNEISDADWKRYVGGERGIFTRALLRGRQSGLVAQLTDKIKRDDEMRRYVMRYVDYFERLLKESQSVDPENLLHSTFMTGDVGKLYLLLCRAIGREPLGD